MQFSGSVRQEANRTSLNNGMLVLNVEFILWGNVPKFWFKDWSQIFNKN